MSRAIAVILFTIPFLAQCAGGQTNYSIAFPNLRFSSPTDMRMPESGQPLFYVTELSGVIKVFDPSDPGVSEAPVFMDITGRVRSGGEMGLLGMAFDPAFVDNGYFYLSYTADNPLRSVISRFRIQTGDPLKGDTTSEKVLLEVLQPYENHNGGSIAFGPDALLYIGLGDGGSGGDPQNRAQDPDSLLGKILRIDVHPVDTTVSYQIPVSNPFALAGGRPEIYAWGLRNPWRFSFDPLTGDLWCGDVGQNAWEEVDMIENGGNYGWRIMEGFHCYNPSNCDSTGLVSPVLEYAHVSDAGSITGGVVNRWSNTGGGNYALLPGEYVYADFVFGTIWALSRDTNGIVVNRVVDSTRLNISTFGTDQRGFIYFCAFNGRIYKFNSTAGVAPRRSIARARFLPNPAVSLGVVEVDLTIRGRAAVDLVDMTGATVRTRDAGILETGPNRVPVDLQGLPSGTYRWRLRVDGESITGPVAIVR